jgi:UDP-N-acetylmuramyl pentapeptide phosphotransferase/UDP-N-acetylglucosamine-1-phosphate transferase
MIHTTSAGQLVLLLTAALIVAAALCACLIVLFMPALRAYALARPNARSSHTIPTPQGGGAAVIAATLATVWLAGTVSDILSFGLRDEFAAVTAAAVLLAILGAVDDIRGLHPLPRLLLQGLAIGIVLAVLPEYVRVLPQLPLWIERAGLFIGGLWFVNLTNFMDGIDWMTVAEVVPVAGTVAVLALLGVLSHTLALIALALLGAMIGFAPFNRPVARLFLGDVGSLPIGLLVGWLLLHVAGSGHVVAAILLPLYYLADATLTLLRRLLRRERIWQAHRSHFYQRATDSGFSVPEIVARVFELNIALAALALLTVGIRNTLISLIALAVGAALVARLLMRFAKGKA